MTPLYRAITLVRSITLLLDKTNLTVYTYSMSKAIRLNEATWDKLFEKIKQDYPPSTFLIRSKMQTVLGFSKRDHTVWDPYYKKEIHLDFFSGPKRTMFLLRYSDILNEKF